MVGTFAADDRDADTKLYYALTPESVRPVPFVTVYFVFQMFVLPSNSNNN